MATLNISLPEPLRDYVDARIEAGRYANVSDYVRDLIRRDQAGIDDKQSWLAELDALIVESVAEMEVGGGVDLDVAVSDALSRIAEDRVAAER